MLSRCRPSRPTILSPNIFLPKPRNPLAAMIGKPFKPPMIQRKPSQPQRRPDPANVPVEPPLKKRRISSDSDQGATTAAAAQFAAIPKPAKKHKTFLTHRAPLGVVNNGPTVGKDSSEAARGAIEGYYTVLWYDHFVDYESGWHLTRRIGGSSP